MSLQENEAAAQAAAAAMEAAARQNASVPNQGSPAEELAAAEQRPMTAEEFGQFIEANHDFFLRVAHKVAPRGLGDTIDFEGLVQQAYLKAWRNLKSFESRSTLRTWLTRIVINEALMARDAFATQQRNLGARQSSTLENDEGEVSDRLDMLPDRSRPDPLENLKAEDLQRLIARLPAVDRDILLVEAENEDLNQQAKAAILGISDTSYKARLFRAREELRQRLSKRGMLAPGQFALNPKLSRSQPPNIPKPEPGESVIKN